MPNWNMMWAAIWLSWIGVGYPDAQCSFIAYISLFHINDNHFFLLLSYFLCAFFGSFCLFIRNRHVSLRLTNMLMLTCTQVIANKWRRKTSIKTHWIKALAATTKKGKNNFNETHKQSHKHFVYVYNAAPNDFLLNDCMPISCQPISNLFPFLLSSSSVICWMKSFRLKEIHMNEILSAERFSKVTLTFT